MGATDAKAARPPYSLWQMVQYMAQLGTIGFGGPVALVGYMQRDLVEERKWISENDYKEGLTLAQLMPGPLAAQLAIYLGYVHYGITGATVVGVAFVLPSFIMVVALGAAYVAYGGLTWMQAVFYGVGACVIGIIALSAYKLTTKSIGKDKLLWAIYIVAAAVTIVTESEIVWIFLISGLLVWLVRAPPKQWLPRGGSAPLVGLVPLGDHLPVACSLGASADWSVLAQARQEAGHRRVRRRLHGGGDRHHRRCGGRARKALDHRYSDHRHHGGDAAASLEGEENSGARDRRACGGRGSDRVSPHQRI